MTLGRSSSGAIKIKTDEAGGGLRAVECACCGGCRNLTEEEYNFASANDGYASIRSGVIYSQNRGVLSVPSGNFNTDGSLSYFDLITDINQNFSDFFMGFVLLSRTTTADPSQPIILDGNFQIYWQFDYSEDFESFTEAEFNRCLSFAFDGIEFEVDLYRAGSGSRTFIGTDTIRFELV